MRVKGADSTVVDDTPYDVKEYHRLYHLANKDKHNAKSRAYHRTHRIEHREQQREWRKNHPLASVHHSMLVRCGVIKSNEAKKLSRYAHRGITVCDEWRDRRTFERWARSNGWKPGLQLDRINNNDGYRPENCRFVTPKENSQNKSNTRFVVFHGERMSLSYFVETVDSVVCKRTLLDRVLRGWDLDAAISKPLHHAARRKG